MNNYITLFVVIPFTGAFVLTFISDRFVKIADFIINIVTTLLVSLSILYIGSGEEINIIYHMGGWPTPFGVDLRLDMLSVLMVSIISIVSFASSIYSVSYMNRYTFKTKFYALFCLLIAGLNGVVITGDIFNLFVFMEIAAIASYALVAFGTRGEELEASLKYAVLGSVASSFILVGIGIIYYVLGTLNMSHIASKLRNVELTGPLQVALVLFITGFGLKAALVPLHAWLPDAHPSAPTPVSAMLSGVVIKALGIYPIIRIGYNIFGPATNFLGILKLLGAISMVVGVLLAIGQWDSKRLMAYHSISQVGYIMIGIGLGTPLGVVGGLFHLLNHSIFKSLLFLTAGSVEYATGTRDLREIGGLRKNMPVTANSCFIGSMSIAGIPIFNGFWSKLLIIMACMESREYFYALCAVVTSILTLGSFLKVLKYAFYREKEGNESVVEEVPVLMRISMLFLAILCIVTSLFVVTGIYNPFLIDEAANALMKGVFIFP